MAIVTFRVDAKRIGQDVSAIIQRKAKGVTTSYALHRDVAITYIDLTSKYIPCKSGKLTMGNRWDSHQKAIVAEAINEKGYDYAPVQWTGDNGSGVPASKWKRANKWGHSGHAHWFIFARRFVWKRFIDECRHIITEAMQNE